jgi:hypothetical protein
MYETLLFFHVLAAFFLGSGVVMYSGFVLGGPVNRVARGSAEALWGIGLLGTIVFGSWLALDEYDILDGWIIAAVVLWILASGAGVQVSRKVQPAGNDSSIPLDRRIAFSHWARVLWVTLLLIDMVWKPGA